MATLDLETKLNPEVLGLRDTQFAAHATQPLDSSTLLAAEVLRVRNLDAVHTPLDSNTVLVNTWDGAR